MRSTVQAGYTPEKVGRGPITPVPGLGGVKVPPSDTRAKKCVSHCPECGSCFASDEAFDLHRRGDFDTGRYCEEPADCKRRSRTGQMVHSLEPFREDGICDVRQGEPRIGVTIWRRARTSLEQAA